MLASVSLGQGEKPQSEFVENMKKLNRALGGPGGDIKAIQKANADHKEKMSKQSLATKIFWIIFTDTNGVQQIQHVPREQLLANNKYLRT